MRAVPPAHGPGAGGGGTSAAAERRRSGPTAALTGSSGGRRGAAVAGGARWRAGRSPGAVAAGHGAGSGSAYEVARQAAAGRQDKVPITYSAVGPGRVQLGDELGLSRAEGTALARLRTGHSPALREWRRLIGLDDDRTCAGCDMGVTEDLTHFMRECPATARLRHETGLGCL